ncbi:uncharacterized protein LOC110709352 [Chenopodium quinoa]|uniref:uncharacterized protein LOC110709352 n=1 Tax=Chenopodium quinoa TaxID=63459 RepID=UPI000B777563|nr:uncharacterized protein LOC110709352 [Chenopodium quinoa]
MGEVPRVTLKELGTMGAYKYESGISPLLIGDSDFEIKPAMIILIERRQYSAGIYESPLNHLKEFENYCNKIKVNRVAQEFIRLKLFPFSLIGRAQEWLDKEVKPNSLRTWDGVTKEFFSRFFPQKNTTEARVLIQGFKHRSSESLYEAWERYKEYQRECPHHGIPTYLIIQIFYSSLSPQGRSSYDAGAGGPIMNKTEEEVVDIIKNVVRHYMEWQDGEKEPINKSSTAGCSFEQLNAINNLSTQISDIGKSFLEDIIEKQAKLLNTYMFLSNEKFNDMLTYHKGSGKVLEIKVSKKSVAKESPSKSQIEIEEDENPLVEEVSKEQVEKVKDKEKVVYKPKLPYPKKFNRHKLDEQFGKFIEILRQIHLTFHCTDVIEQMPNHAKFLKEILSGNRTCDVAKTVSLTENGSAIIMNKIPPKLKDPGNFSIPFAIYKMQIDNALCDLGASVSIMPYSVYQRLENRELLPTNITLQLADRSIRIPRGKVEDVPLRVGKFIILVDFMVLEIDEDSTIPIIFGRPLLSTSGVLIDVKSAKISLKIGDAGVEFDLNESMKYPSSSLENCVRVKILDNLVHSMHEHLLTTNDPLECVLLNKKKIGAPSKEMSLY